MTKEIKVIFEPGCFDDFEGTQEELDAMMAEIQRMADTGELFENAEPVDFDELEELAKEDSDYQLILDKLVEPENAKRRLH